MYFLRVSYRNIHIEEITSVKLKAASPNHVKSLTNCSNKPTSLADKIRKYICEVKALKLKPYNYSIKYSHKNQNADIED